MTGYAIYTRESLLAKYPSQFKRLGAYETGTQRTPLQPFVPDFDRDYVTFIIRKLFRSPHSAVYKNGDKNQWRNYYTAHNVEYVVARIYWSSIGIEELSNHGADKTAAVKELKRLVKAGK